VSFSSFKKTLSILAVAAVLCLGVAHFVPDFTGSPVTSQMHEVLAPLQEPVLMVMHGAASLLDYFGDIHHLQTDNNQLQQQVRDLTLENASLYQYVYEDQQLDKLLDFKNHNAACFTLLGARVISRSPNDWDNTLVLDRGSQDGVAKDMVVVSDSGLIGRVDAVSPHTAEVLLILDPECAAGAVVPVNGTQGVIEGNKDDPQVLRMIDLPYDAKLERGQSVVTSGLGGIFPGTLPIGKVLQMGGSDLNRYALIQPDVDFNRIEDVFIVTAAQPVQEPVASNQTMP
jgi:rod shape-determining protein MreC